MPGPSGRLGPLPGFQRMTRFILLVFLATYLGMALGGVPGLRISRAGVALLAAVALLATGALSLPAATSAVDLPTLVILFALMCISGQFAASGLYGFLAARVAAAAGSPARLLALVVVAGGLLSAFLTNDIVVFAMTPLLCQGLKARGLEQRPYLAALAGSANAGSAASLIGNPQNILIGSVGHLRFWHFLAVAAPVAAAALLVTYVTVRVGWRKVLAQVPRRPAGDLPTFDRWQTGKGFLSLLLLLVLFATPLSRPLAALIAMSPLFVSRRISTEQVLGTVDWGLILLFACLFIVNAGLGVTHLPAVVMRGAAASGLDPGRLSVMAPFALIASNTIGNVPAVMMILGPWATASKGALYGLALLTTLAGNLLLTGSIANIIVSERAGAEGVAFGFRDQARAGVPMALISLGLACLWLGFGGWMAWI